MSAVIRGTALQTGADTFTSASIDTNIQVDGKSGWEIVDFVAYWSNAETAAAGDMDVNCILATRPTITSFNETDEIARINWGVQNTAGVAVAFQVDMVKRCVQFLDRVTVQPYLYINLASTGSGLACGIAWEIRYNVVKLTDLEVMRLLQGGA
jgi:hypothetical protein